MSWVVLVVRRGVGTDGIFYLLLSPASAQARSHFKSPLSWFVEKRLPLYPSPHPEQGSFSNSVNRRKN